jgi:HEAT repeat protein
VGAESALILALGHLADRGGWDIAARLLEKIESPDEETLVAALVISPYARAPFDIAQVRAFETAPRAWVFARFRDASAGVVPWNDERTLASAAALEALAFSGDPKAHPVLLAALGSEDEDLAHKAAHALSLISGRSVKRRVERVDPDERDSSPTTVSELSKNAGDWEPLLAPLARGVTRLGEPISEDAGLFTLRHPMLGSNVRRWAVWEHALRKRERPPVAAGQFVRAQRRILFGG